MWIFSKYGFFSVTQHAQRRDLIQIRARTDRDLLDLVAAFPMLDRCPLHETPTADYRFRLVIARWKWELLGTKLTADIDYSNFKGKVATIPTQRNKGDMLHRIWSIHHRYQEDRHAPDPLAGHPELFRKAGDALFEDDEPDSNPENDFWNSDDKTRFDADYEASLAEAEAREAASADPFMEENRKAAENTIARDAERKQRRAAKKGKSVLPDLKAAYDAAKQAKREKNR